MGHVVHPNGFVALLDMPKGPKSTTSIPIGFSLRARFSPDWATLHLASYRGELDVWSRLRLGRAASARTCNTWDVNDTELREVHRSRSRMRNGDHPLNLSLQ